MTAVIFAVMALISPTDGAHEAAISFSIDVFVLGLNFSF